MAVAGFSENDIAIEAHRNVLSIKGERKEESNGEGSEVLYRGIAARAFERRFQLADHVEVTGAALKNGLLHIDLKRHVPEELKPRKIEITVGRQGRQADRDDHDGQLRPVISMHSPAAPLVGAVFVSGEGRAPQLMRSPKR